MKLRTSLMLLAAAALVPLLIFAVAAVALLVEHERDTMERESMGRAISAMSAVDAKLRGSITMLEALATSRSLQVGDLSAFGEEARRALATQPEWLNVGLAAPSRQPLVAATLPFAESAASGDDSAFDQVLSMRKPAIGNVQPGTAARGADVRVRVPVVVDGTLRYVLSAALKPSAFTDLLRAQQVSLDWVIALADRKHHVVARIPEVAVGTPVSESFAAELGRAPQGWFRGRTLEGHETYTPYVTSALSGWALGIAIPASTVEAGMRKSFALAAGGVLDALALALLFAWLLARRIEAPVAALVRAAEAMGRGERVQLDDGFRIDEVRRLSVALREASVALSERQALTEHEKKELERAQQALRAADTAKDQFIAMLSHELRNPLAALTSATELLKAVKLTDPVAVHAGEVAARQAKQMARMVEDLLDVSRIVAGKADVRPERFDLADASRQLIAAWRAAGRFAAHKVTYDGEPVDVCADRARMEQILGNLLDNALKFTPPRGAIRVAVGRHGDDAVLRVDDEGEGIDADLLPHLFELFAQGAQGLGRRKGGLGIGLAVVKRLVELQGGSVEASSSGGGRGTTFVVRLPALRDAPSAVAELQPMSSVASTARRRILVIEDNQDMRQMLRVALALDSGEVRDAHDGTSGLQRAAEMKPDVVLVDIGLPDIDGYEVARRLRAQSSGGDMRLIALTGYGQADDARRAAAAGFDAHLTKPVTHESLTQAIIATQGGGGAAGHA